MKLFSEKYERSYRQAILEVDVKKIMRFAALLNRGAFVDADLALCARRREWSAELEAMQDATPLAQIERGVLIRKLRESACPKLVAEADRLRGELSARKRRLDGLRRERSELQGNANEAKRIRAVFGPKIKPGEVHQGYNPIERRMEVETASGNARAVWCEKRAARLPQVDADIQEVEGDIRELKPEVDRAQSAVREPQNFAFATPAKARKPESADLGVGAGSCLQGW